MREEERIPGALKGMIFGDGRSVPAPMIWSSMVPDQWNLAVPHKMALLELALAFVPGAAAAAGAGAGARVAGPAARW